MKDIDANYYGFRDEDEYLLIANEKKQERRGKSYILFIIFD